MTEMQEQKLFFKMRMLELEILTLLGELRESIEQDLPTQEAKLALLRIAIQDYIGLVKRDVAFQGEFYNGNGIKFINDVNSKLFDLLSKYND